MIKVLFFAQVRELVNTDSLTLDASFENVAACARIWPHKATAGRWRWTKASCWRRLTRRWWSLPSAEGRDEVAFFPPVTGAK
jgi:molybdopterin synthase sulfur carrier subunit